MKLILLLHISKWFASWDKPAAKAGGSLSSLETRLKPRLHINVQASTKGGEEGKPSVVPRPFRELTARGIRFRNLGLSGS